MTADIGLDIGAPCEAMFEVGSASSGDSFSFGVEREMKESGEKGGTADMNIGVGELQECTVSKSMDAASAKLAQFAINGNSPGTAEIDFVEVAGGGDAGKEWHDTKPMGWDNTTHKKWTDNGIEFFIADSFSFGVEREMKESGEKGGTADMNIGVGELQECTVSKSMDAASAKLAQFAINGNSPRYGGDRFRGGRWWRRFCATVARLNGLGQCEESALGIRGCRQGVPVVEHCR